MTLTEILENEELRRHGELVAPPLFVLENLGYSHPLKLCICERPARSECAFPRRRSISISEHPFRFPRRLNVFQQEPWSAGRRVLRVFATRGIGVTSATVLESISEARAPRGAAPAGSGMEWLGGVGSRAGRGREDEGGSLKQA